MSSTNISVPSVAFQNFFRMGVDLIIYDFDGVMTDNKVIVNEEGLESIVANRGDGFGIKQITLLGIKQIIISTETNCVVRERAEKLNLEVIYGTQDKGATIIDYCNKHTFNLDRIMFIGNDLNDYEAMKRVGFRGCPNDAEAEIKEIADWISKYKGGEGVIRELYRLIEYVQSIYNLKDPIREFNLRNPQKQESIKKGAIYAIIPARSGSKGIVDKNIKDLFGYPLIAYSIAAAHLVPEVSRVIVSTDSEKYAEIARIFGAETPFLRPVELSGDASQDIDFMLHTINWLFEDEHEIPEYFLHLRPTFPLREFPVLQNAITCMKLDESATSLRSAHRSMASPYKWFQRTESGYFKPLFSHLTLDDANRPRQDFSDVFIPNGYVDILKSETILGQLKMHGDRMIACETPQGVDVDTINEFNQLSNDFGLKNNEIYLYLKQHFSDYENKY